MLFKDKKLAKEVHEPNFSRVDLVMTLMVYVYIHSFQIVCRCQTPVAESVKSKISLFCHVEPQQVYYLIKTIQRYAYSVIHA